MVLDMEKETNKVDWNNVGFSLLLLGGMIYGAHRTAAFALEKWRYPAPRAQRLQYLAL